MVILGIETSCDETAASVIKDGRYILSHIIASSAKMHEKTGGIIPEQAARRQIRSIIPVIAEALAQSKKGVEAVDAIAITFGPGLIGSLLVGVETAKTLSHLWNKPIVPVNHLVAHIYANWLITEKEIPLPRLPAVSLVVSGGHTDLVLMNDHGKLKWLGGTRDDAAGEAFDKIARLLGLPYPGGPEISRLAETAQPAKSKFALQIPRPMMKQENFDFSHSGLKTAVIREVQKLKNRKLWSKQVKALVAYEVQEAITDVLVAKTIRAASQNKVSTLLLAGGVAANKRLREKFQVEIESRKLKIDLRVAPPWLCTDNASYIASYAEYNYSPIPWQKISAVPGLTIMGEQ